MARVTNAIVIDAPQRSEKWFAARLGNVTGSKGKDAIRSVEGIDAKHAAIRAITGQKALSAKYKLEPEYNSFISKTGYELYKQAGLELPNNEKRISYMRTRVAERLTGMSSETDKFVSQAMLWGQQNERLAQAKYQIATGNKVDEAFFLLHPELRCGASPDGNVTDVVTGEIGVLEIKCLETWNHLYKIMQKQEVPEEFLVQIQMEMWLSNTDFCDFVGYDSRVPGKLDIFIKRVRRDDWFIDEVLEPEIRIFLDEVDRNEAFFRIKAREGFGFDAQTYREVANAEV